MKPQIDSLPASRSRLAAVLRASKEVVSVDVARKMPPHWYHQPREHVVKNGSPVGTAAFLTAEYAGVSALLYSSLDLVNAGLRVRDPLGSEMYYFHNPQASTPLPRGPFKFGREYVANLDQGKLTHREWHKARP